MMIVAAIMTAIRKTEFFAGRLVGSGGRALVMINLSD
jgi:hypothetical protein